MSTINNVSPHETAQVAADRRRRDRIAYTNPDLVQLLRMTPGPMVEDEPDTAAPPKLSLLPLIAGSVVIWAAIAANVFLLLRHHPAP